MRQVMQTIGKQAIALCVCMSVAMQILYFKADVGSMFKASFRFAHKIWAEN